MSYGITRPRNHGTDYLNRKGYHSVLFQAVCDAHEYLHDVFAGPPGKVHDARMSRLSPLYAAIGQRLLLGNSAYVSGEFAGNVTPKRAVGQLTATELQTNTAIKPRSRCN